ncbi:MAG: HlyD family efflux transporter periplasmic adaptor subunit [Paludibacteraceae bacterium]|nr:HlyD family efflux transporter periplasmic adaptor subunit [Paludibacteraceae bacterium]
MQLPSDIENTVAVLNGRYNKNNYIIYKLILLALIIVFIALPLVEVDITSQSRGIVRSSFDNVSVTPIVSGKVKFANIEKNKSVSKGDTLLVIETLNIDDQIHAQETLCKELKDKIADLKILTGVEEGELKTSLYKEEFAEYNARQRDLQIKKEQSLREFKRTKEGHKLGLVSEYEYKRMNDELQLNTLNITTAQTQQQSSWQHTKQQLEEQLISVEGDIKRMNSELTNYVVTSPISGTLVLDAQIQVGTYITAGSQIATITPEEQLIVECYVEPTDIGFIEVGQQVALQYDAFNYNQWGLGQAEVIDIDKNASVQEGKTFFAVRCKMINSTLSLKNGYTVNIKKGMTLSGRFFITQRTLWQLLFDKIDDWFNPKMK